MVSLLNSFFFSCEDDESENPAMMLIARGPTACKWRWSRRFFASSSILTPLARHMIRNTERAVLEVVDRLSFFLLFAVFDILIQKNAHIGCGIIWSVG